MASKYHAQKWAGYDSKREARRAAELRLMEAAGEISNLREQVKYELIPAQYENVPRVGKNGRPLKPGKRCVEKSCCYVADFVYDENGVDIVEDSKGFRSADYKIKRKLMLFIHGIKIRET